MSDETTTGPEQRDEQAAREREEVLAEGRQVLRRLEDELIRTEMRAGRDLARKVNERAGYLLPTALRKSEGDRADEPAPAGVSKSESDLFAEGRRAAAAFNKRRGL